MKGKTAEEFVKKGREMLGARDFKAAEKAFNEALRIDNNIVTRNNLALAIFMAGAPRRALQVLEPYLENLNTGANPFTYALAARICCSLGQKERARQQLQQAERSFNAGLSEFRRARRMQEALSFREYTVIIMRAAADLEDHRLVFDLYRQWESYHVSWENKHLAAVACFNLGRYQRAASLWASIAREHSSFSGMQQVAFQVERGVIPPFEMGYKLYSDEESQEMLEEIAREGEEASKRFMQDGFYRMSMLNMMLLAEGDTENASQAAYVLAKCGGDWGEKLARRILDAPGFSSSVKMAAANALMDRGLLEESEPVSMFIDGEQRLVEVKRILLQAGPDKELDEKVHRAMELRDKGEVDEAISLLQGMHQQNQFYPPAMMTLANLLRQKGELKESLQLMNMLKKIDPENPVLLFNLSSLMVQMDEPDRALEYWQKINPNGMGQEFQRKMKELKEGIDKAQLVKLLRAPGALVWSYAEEQRQKIEEKNLSVNSTLSRGLKNMPAHWLDGMCFVFGIEPARRRREREEQIKDFLGCYENLEWVVQDLDDEERELLQYLLQRGGWSRLNAVTRKFGSHEGDGFFWDEEEPESPLGCLWSRALLMVGKASLEGRRWKIATIPRELRQPLGEILGTTPS